MSQQKTTATATAKTNNINNKKIILMPQSWTKHL